MRMKEHTSRVKTFGPMSSLMPDMNGLTSSGGCVSRPLLAYCSHWRIVFNSNVVIAATRRRALAETTTDINLYQQVPQRQR